MPTNRVYERLLSEANPGLERRVLEILVDHVGQENRIKRDDLVRRAIYGDSSFAKITDTDDRKVRLAVANLQEQGYPILSDSREGGRWLAKPDEIEAFIAELESRREKLAGKIRALRNSDKLAWSSPEEQPVQGRLF